MSESESLFHWLSEKYNCFELDTDGKNMLGHYTAQQILSLAEKLQIVEPKVGKLSLRQTLLIHGVWLDAVITSFNILALGINGNVEQLREEGNVRRLLQISPELPLLNTTAELVSYVDSDQFKDSVLAMLLTENCTVNIRINENQSVSHSGKTKKWLKRLLFSGWDFEHQRPLVRFLCRIKIYFGLFDFKEVSKVSDTIFELRLREFCEQESKVTLTTENLRLLFWLCRQLMPLQVRRIQDDISRPVFGCRKFCLVTHNLFDDESRALAARCVGQGILVGSYQHGGGYFFNRHNGFSRWWESLMDFYLTWGWEGSLEHFDFSIKMPFPSPLLRKKKKTKESGPLTPIFVGASDSRGELRVHSKPIGLKAWHKYIKRKKVLVEGLIKLFVSVDVRDPLLPDDVKRRVNLISCSTDQFHSQLDQALIVILDNLMTTFNIIVRKRVPVVVMIDESNWEMHPRARNIATKMMHIGMLHLSPKSALDFLGTIRDQESIDLWWSSDPVRAVRTELEQTISYI